MFVTSGSGTMTVDGKEHKLEAGYIFYVCPGTKLKYQASGTMAIYEAVV